MSHTSLSLMLTYCRHKSTIEKAEYITHTPFHTYISLNKHHIQMVKWKLQMLLRFAFHAMCKLFVLRTIFQKTFNFHFVQSRGYIGFIPKNITSVHRKVSTYRRQLRETLVCINFPTGRITRGSWSPSSTRGNSQPQSSWKLSFYCTDLRHIISPMSARNEGTFIFLIGS